MEAMKLIFPLVASRAGTVAALLCAPGDIVPRGQTLVQLEPLAPLTVSRRLVAVPAISA